jgi:hypothetical protein
MTKSATASAGAFQALGSAMGGLPFAAQIGQFSALAQQVKSLNQNMAGGRLQMLGMTAAMGAAAAVAGFQLGKAIGDVIFQTKKYNEEIDKGIQRSNEMASRMAALAQQQRQERVEGIELIRDPEAKAKAQQEYINSLNRELAGTENNMRAAQKELEQHTNQWTIWRGERAASMKMAENEIEQARQRHKALQEERDAIQRRNRIAAEQAPIIAENQRLDALDKVVETIQQQNAQLRLGNDEYQRQLELSNAITAAERQRIEQLQAEREQLKKAEEDRQESERKQQQTKQASDAFLQNLEAQKILLTEGQEAADEYRARLSGVSEEAIEQGRLLRQEIAALQDAQEETADKLETSFTPGVTAKETRLLTGRSGVRDDPVFKVQQNTFALLKEFREEKRTQRNQLEELRLIRRGRRIGQFVP